MSNGIVNLIKETMNMLRSKLHYVIEDFIERQVTDQWKKYDRSLYLSRWPFMSNNISWH